MTCCGNDLQKSKTCCGNDLWKSKNPERELMRITQEQRIAISMSCYNIYIELLTYVELYVTLIMRTYFIEFSAMQVYIQAFNTRGFRF